MYQIQNDCLIVKASRDGAQLKSIRNTDGLEYLWQGDETYWSDSAPNIFPYVARLTEGRYLFHGESYSMPIHGFASTSQFQGNILSSSSMIFTLQDSPATLSQYPFPFSFSILYALEASSLKITFSVINTGSSKMYFGLGGHPGIQVPLEAGLSFSDYVLKFPSDSQLQKECFSPDCFPLDQRVPFPLVENQLALQHSLFDEDAIILSQAPRYVTLCSPRGIHGVTLHTGGLPYLGLWHRPKSDAPYICLEPWSSLPSRKGVVEDLSTQPSLIALDAGRTYEVTWGMDFF